MAVPPKLNSPRLGQPISRELSYVQRASAQKQAAYWNMHLAEDPTFGPASGFAIGVAPTKNEDGRYQLIWVSVQDDDKQAKHGSGELLIADGQHRSSTLLRALEEARRSGEQEPRNRAERRATQRRRRGQ